MRLRRFAFVLGALGLLGAVPACSAIVSPDTTRLGGGPDTGGGTLDGGGTDGGGTIDAAPGDDTGMPGVDGGMGCPAGCDDGVTCTTDTCDTTSSTCRHVANDGACGSGQRCSLTMGCVSSGCTSDAECSDGDACNGAERCTGGSCVGGTALDCDDHVDCTTDACNAGSGCTHATNDAACDDTIACTTDSCTLDGCHYEADDAVCNAGCFSGASCQVGVGCTGGAMTVCSPDGDGCTSDPTACDVASGTCLHPPRDDDGDGFPTATANGMACAGGTDCNDMNGAIHPGATELCNGIDDNCDGTVDESGCLPPGPDDCASETAIPLSISGGTGRSGTVTGSNVGDSDDYTSMCGRSGGLDAVYYVDLPPGGGATATDVTFSTESTTTTFDTVLAATMGNTCGTNFGATRVCNDDISSTNRSSRVTICIPGTTVATGTRVHVLVDGYDGSASGNYQVRATVTAHPGGVCP